MARYIATVEFDDGQYWISFPGIEKAGSHAKRPEEIVPHARRFLNEWIKTAVRCRCRSMTLSLGRGCRAVRRGEARHLRTGPAVSDRLARRHPR